MYRRATQGVLHEP